MKQMNWHTYQMKFPDKAANYPGGEQAFNQQQQIVHDNWAYPGGIGKPQGGGGQHPLTALGLAGYQGGQTNPQIQNPQIPVQDGGPRKWPPRGNPFAPPPSNPIPQWGSEVMKGFGEFGETLGGYGEQLGGFGEQLGGFGNQITGFNEQFSNINNKLQNMEEGITGLTNKLNNQQQTQSSQPYSNPYQGLQSMLYGNYGGYQSPFTNNYSFY
jgi:hypothetical protein